MDSKIGSRIKQLREYYGIQQVELARDICRQSTISRIEKNEITPSAYILHRLAQRLGVQINYFFGTSQEPHVDYAKEVIDLLTKLVLERNYEEVLKTVKLESKNPLFQHDELRQILLWREGLCIYYLYKDIPSAFARLDESLSLTSTTSKNKSSVQLEVLMGKATIYGEIGDFEKAEVLYREILGISKRIPNLDYKVLIRALYNCSVNAHNMKNYQQSVVDADKAIQVCVKNYSMYLLGESYFQKGESYFAYSNSAAESKKWISKSLEIFETLNNTAAYKFVQEELKKY